jgi:hypothetical protein
VTRRAKPFDDMRRIVNMLATADLVYANEYDLQDGIYRALVQAGYATLREVRLSDPRNRIDLLVSVLEPDDHIGIEVKIGGSRAGVIRQLTRYAGEPSITGLILVTTRAKHSRIPTEINGKPVRLCSLIGVGL